MHSAPFAFISRARTSPARKDQERGEEEKVRLRSALGVRKTPSRLDSRNFDSDFFFLFFPLPRASPPSLSFQRAITCTPFVFPQGLCLEATHPRAQIALRNDLLSRVVPSKVGDDDERTYRQVRSRWRRTFGFAAVWQRNREESRWCPQDCIMEPSTRLRSQLKARSQNGQVNNF